MRLMRFLTNLALLLAPLSMIGGHAAMATPAAVEPAAHHEQAANPSPHCAGIAGETEDNDDRSAPGDCLTDCALACSAIPPLASAMADQPLALALDQPLPLVGRVRGLHPQSADPPPRIA